MKYTVIDAPFTACRDQPFSKQEQATVSAICNRVVRVLGLQDRDGLQRDLAIVQANCPIDLDALAAASEKVFMEELLSIVDSTDRATGSLRGNFSSRFMLDAPGLTLV
ncbi:hypothetical protein R0137_02585 [Congregibacter brevis]|uniref:DUF6874 domain-containing protein n=1 Tax=Congregibacter brevis TaxID=3081201 RepID=A0ABZ0ID50_9GAMM|nr:hypothetical protein R0137_02585 [Congregibacter sp. IMCC45268]